MARQEDSEAALASLTKSLSQLPPLQAAPRMADTPGKGLWCVKDTTLKGNFKFFSVSKYQTLQKAAGHAAKSSHGISESMSPAPGESWTNIAGWHKAKQLNSPNV